MSRTGSPRPTQQAAPAGAPDAEDGRVPRAAYLLVAAVSVLLGATAVVRNAGSLTSIADSDLANFFLKSADYIVRGDPWHMYAARAAPPYATYPNVDPPLSIVVMAPLLRWARALGFASTVTSRVAFVSLFFVPLVPLLAALVARTLRSAHPAASATTRFLAFALIALGPLSWICCATWGHVEQPLMLCLLVASVGALQARHAALAGVLAGLSILAGTAALFPVAALVSLLIANREWRRGALVGGLAVVVVVLGIAPFLVFDRRDVVYAFVTWHGREPIGGNSIWSIFTVEAIVRALPHAVGGVVRRLDTPLILALAVAVAALAARRLRVSADGPAVWAVLCMAALGLPMLAKVVWPYYYLQPFVLLLLYECATVQRGRADLWRWPVLSVGFLVVATTLAQYVGLKSVGALDRVAVGALEFGIMLLVLLATWRRLQIQA